MPIRRIRTPSGIRCHNGRKFVKCRGGMSGVTAKKKAAPKRRRARKAKGLGKLGARSSTSFLAGNKNATALKMTKGRGSAPCCDRKAVLKAVKAGMSPAAAVARHCPASCATGGGQQQLFGAGWGW